MASSRPIAAGEEYTPDDINNLRSDVLDGTSGHKHDGTDGAKVPFANLDVVGAAGSTVPAGGSKSYNDIAGHVATSQGVHQLKSSAHVFGAMSSGLVMQCGYVSTGGGYDDDVYFPTAFSAAPLVIIVTLHTSAGTQNDWPWDAGCGYRNPSPTKFRLRVGHSGTNQGIVGASWMAIGTLP